MRRLILFVWILASLNYVYGQNVSFGGDLEVFAKSDLTWVISDSVSFHSEKFNAEQPIDVHLFGALLEDRSQTADTIEMMVYNHHSSDTLEFMANDQIIISGYLGSKSSNGVIVKNNTTITDTVDVKGSMILAGGHLTLTRGVGIGGYDTSNYIVTNSRNKLKKLVAQGERSIFPFGTRSHYLPLCLVNYKSERCVGSLVKSGVEETINSSTELLFPNVGYSWFVQSDADQDSFDINLQVNEDLGKHGFLRDKSFISRYVGAVENTEGDSSSPHRWSMNKWESSGPGVKFNLMTTTGPSNKSYILKQTRANSGGYYTIMSLTSTDEAVPVDMISFRGNWLTEVRDLQWETASEFNSKEFELWRKDKYSEERLIATIASQAENGLSSNLLSYQFIDKEETTETLLYYRLVQKDFDGATDTSNWIALTKDKSDFVKVLPNPTTDKFKVKSSIPFETLDVYSSRGLLVERINLNTPVQDLTIPCNTWRYGVYYVFLRSGSTILKQRVIVK